MNRLFQRQAAERLVRHALEAFASQAAPEEAGLSKAALAAVRWDQFQAQLAAQPLAHQLFAASRELLHLHLVHLAGPVEASVIYTLGENSDPYDRMRERALDGCMTLVAMDQAWARFCAEELGQDPDSLLCFGPREVVSDLLDVRPVLAGLASFLAVSQDSDPEAQELGTHLSGIRERHYQRLRDNWRLLSNRAAARAETAAGFPPQGVAPKEEA